MDFRTKVEIPKFNYTITYQDKLMLLGSCFAESIGSCFNDRKFVTDINPFGIIYNPVSLLNCIEILENKKKFNETDLFNEEGIWKSFYHHSRFSNPDLSATLSNINERILYSSAFIRSTSYLFLTLGTAWVFENTKTGKVVSNCHKRPSTDFNHRLLSVDETYSALKTIIDKIKAINPECIIVFTLSPVRHLKNGAHGNQVSKAVLTLAIQKLTEQGQISYFPAYEILLDELRDYRFYDTDMIHPSKIAIQYIWEKLCDTFMNNETIKNMKEIENIVKAIHHRPFFPTTQAYQDLLKSVSIKICDIETKLPHLDFNEEKNMLKI